MKTLTTSIEDLFLDKHKFMVKYNITGKYIPAKMYLKNGDPGYPTEYPDIEIDTIFYQSPIKKRYIIMNTEKLPVLLKEELHAFLYDNINSDEDLEDEEVVAAEKKWEMDNER